MTGTLEPLGDRGSDAAMLSSSHVSTSESVRAVDTIWTK